MHHGSTRRVLVVDAANVVGSVPDGWWHDRAGATARLHAALVKAPLPYDEILLIVEGKARAGVAAGRSGKVTTVHATGEGDEDIVAACTQLKQDTSSITLATADRGLIARVAPLGVTLIGPKAVPRS